MPTRSWWGWGWAEEAVPEEAVGKLARSLSERFGVALTARRVPRLDDVELPEPRVAPPEALTGICSTTTYERTAHAYGRAYRDVVRGSYGRYPAPPDVVARPTSEEDVTRVLDWCATADLACLPYGGGSSVVGGVEYRGEGDKAGWVSMDLTALDRVLDVDTASRAARIQGGAMGPVLEDQLRPHGYTLRHFPQSFEFSTLGGWLATRSGGHFATLYTHIDDLVESIRCVTPSGVTESRRLPGSGAGPSPDRLLLGSEGALGAITEAWVRVQDRPRFRSSTSAAFADLAAGAEAARALSQSGLFPTNCRLLDPGEAATSAGVTDGSATLVLGFESADHPTSAWMDRALELVRDHGGAPAEVVTSDAAARDANRSAGRQGAVGAWRNAFVRAPYTRDALVRLSVVVETFETACTWDRFAELHRAVTAAATDAVNRVCGAGMVTCRFTHVYPDGPAPYYSVYGPGRPGSEVAMWDEIKAAVSEALADHGGTITHHHAVGRDHDAVYRRQRPDLHGRMLAAAKAAVDPRGICNPGVIA